MEDATGTGKGPFCQVCVFLAPGDHVFHCFNYCIPVYASGTMPAGSPLPIAIDHSFVRLVIAMLSCLPHALSQLCSYKAAMRELFDS